jgi:protein-tyrosine phosphatase family protein
MAGTSNSVPGPRPRGSARRVFIVIAAVLAAVWFWNAAIKGNLSPKNFGVVDEGRVYRAGQLSPSAMRMVRDKHHIKTVIDLGSYEPGARGERRNQQVADALGMTRFVFDLEGDATGNPNYYVQALRIMNDPARQPVLVHCGAGSERTGCVAILYNNEKHGTPLNEGLRGAREFRHDPRRNPHLEETVNAWAGPILKAYREGGTIPGTEPLPEPEPAGVAGKEVRPSQAPR